MRTPIDDFAKLAITFGRGTNKNSVILRRSDDTFSISEGDKLHTIMNNKMYNVTVKKIVFSSSNQLFQKLVVDLEGIDDGSRWSNQMVWNVPLFNTFLNYQRHELQNNCDFWIHLNTEFSTDVAVTPSPKPKTPSSKPGTPSSKPGTPSRKPSKSPLSPKEGFNFRVINGNLQVTNMHGIEFEILPNTRFISYITFTDNNIQPNRIGRIEGIFENFNNTEAKVKIEFVNNYKKNTYSYESDLEFWQNLEIVTHSQRFPNDGQINCTSSDKIDVYDSQTHKLFVFKKGDKFETIVFRPSTWLGYFRQRIDFDFNNQTSGNIIKIYGKFESFDHKNKTATISIDYNTTEKAWIAIVAFLFVAAATWYATSKGTGAPGFHILGAPQMQPTSAPYSDLSIDGGGFFTYTVDLSNGLQFWKNLNVTNATCKLAEARNRNNVQKVHDASNETTSQTSSTTTKSSAVPTKTKTISSRLRNLSSRLRNLLTRNTKRSTKGLQSK